MLLAMIDDFRVQHNANHTSHWHCLLQLCLNNIAVTKYNEKPYRG